MAPAESLNLYATISRPFLTVHCHTQVFYSQFGELMMRQPVIGLDFQSWMPLAIVPYMLMLVFNVFNRYNAPRLASSFPCPLLPAGMEHCQAE